MTPIALALILTISFLLQFFPKKYVPILILIAICYIPMGSRVMIGPLDFTAIKILIFFGFIRVIIRKEFYLGRINNVDKMFILWAITFFIMNFIRSNDIAGSLNVVYDALGLYFLLRFFINDLSDITRLIKAISMIFIPIALSMIYEKLTGFNLFSIIGGVSPFSAIREGRLRAQGPFSHPILAGTTAATLIPLMLSLWWDGPKNRKFSLIGIFVCILIMILVASSGPIMTFLFGCFAMIIWLFRDNLRFIRRYLILLLIFLHIVMKAPVWYLIARIDLVGGSAGYHRAELITQALNHLNEWWLYGTNYTRHWMPTGVTWSLDHADITNYYIKMGILGGLPLLIVFILLIRSCFMGIKTGLNRIQDKPFNIQIKVWALGAVLFAHTVTFISVSYFDQITVFWYMLLSLISTISNYQGKNEVQNPSLIQSRNVQIKKN